MGEKLLELYREAKEIGGLEAQIKIALITKISNSKAREVSDSPENIRLFEKALSIIKNNPRE